MWKIWFRDIRHRVRRPGWRFFHLRSHILNTSVNGLCGRSFNVTKLSFLLEAIVGLLELVKIFLLLGVRPRQLLVLLEQ